MLLPKVLFALLAVFATTPTAVQSTTATCAIGNPKVAEQPTATPADCHHDDERRLIQRHLATKTPYRVVANLDDAPADYAGCRPTRIWAMVRHGTRHPNRRIVRSMAGRLRQLRDDIVRAQRSGAATAAADGAEATLCKRDVELFEHWPPAGSVAAGLRESGEMELTAEGHAELAALAERMQNRFADLMPDVYRNQSYLFKFTDSQRTRKSFEAFATGLFGRNNIHNVWHPQPSKRDPILRFYKLCARWSLDVDDNPLAVAEADAFRRSVDFQAAVSSVRRKAGLADELSANEAHLMYTLCAFETAWDAHVPSPWCTVFDGRSVRAFEYLEDLEYYHVDGYGTPLTYQQACPALNDMLQRLTAVDDGKLPPATFYFSHSGTVLKMLALLGLYRDAEPLDHRAFAGRAAEERRWRVSRIDAFASNLAFVMYNCSTDAGATSSSHLLVQHQERVVRLDGCPTDSDLCPLAQFRSVFRHALGDNCRFDELCSIAVTPNPEL